MRLASAERGKRVVVSPGPDEKKKKEKNRLRLHRYSDRKETGVDRPRPTSGDGKKKKGGRKSGTSFLIFSPAKKKKGRGPRRN